MPENSGHRQFAGAPEVSAQAASIQPSTPPRDPLYSSVRCTASFVRVYSEEDMGHFLAVTAFRTESIPAVVQTISDFMRTHEVTYEVLSAVPSINENTDAQIFAPADGWTVVLWPQYFNIHDFPLVRSIASSFPELISTIHVYDGDYWEHLAVLGARELHTFCSRPTYWCVGTTFPVAASQPGSPFPLP